MNVGIAVDNWKLPVFRDRLTATGYRYADGGALTAEATLLTVETSNILALKKIIEQCQAECRKGVS